LTVQIGRNDPCHCGSGKKYKKCCLENDANKSTSDIYPGDNICAVCGKPVNIAESFDSPDAVKADGLIITSDDGKRHFVHLENCLAIMEKRLAEK